jgi:hypothetical protein
VESVMVVDNIFLSDLYTSNYFFWDKSGRIVQANILIRHWIGYLKYYLLDVIPIIYRFGAFIFHLFLAKPENSIVSTNEYAN